MELSLGAVLPEATLAWPLPGSPPTAACNFGALAPSVVAQAQQWTQWAVALQLQNACLKQQLALLQDAFQQCKESAASGASSPSTTPSTSASSSPKHVVATAFRPPPGLPPPPLQLPRPAVQPIAAELGEGPRSVEWCIWSVTSKLRVSAGFPLISPQLQLGGLSDLRVHFSPGDAWMAERRSQKQRSKRSAQESQTGCALLQGAPHGSLKFKLGELEERRSVRLFLWIGSHRQGPFECSFTERGVPECVLEVDWRQQLEEGGTLRLRLELPGAADEA